MLNLEDRIGVSTACFYPDLTEKAFDEICRLNVRVCELFINTSSETKPDYLREIKLKADDNNIRIAAVHPYFSGYEHFLFFTEYYGKRRLTDGIDLYKQFFEAAQFLCADYVIFHGMAGGKPKIGIAEYNARFLLIAAEAEKHNCELLHENIGAVNDYLQDLENVKFALDFKHSVSRGYDNLDIIEKMGENIAHIHINDMIISASANKTDDCRLPFSGSLDYKKIFDKLTDINYIGNFIIEVYRHNYTNIAEISESIEKCRDFFKIWSNSHEKFY